MVKLESLNLDENQIEDISVLKGLNDIEFISCEDNLIKEEETLKSLTGLADKNHKNNKEKEQKERKED